MPPSRRDRAGTAAPMPPFSRDRSTRHILRTLEQTNAWASLLTGSAPHLDPTCPHRHDRFLGPLEPDDFRSSAAQPLFSTCPARCGFPNPHAPAFHQGLRCATAHDLLAHYLHAPVLPTATRILQTNAPAYRALAEQTLTHPDPTHLDLHSIATDTLTLLDHLDTPPAPDEQPLTLLVRPPLDDVTYRAAMELAFTTPLAQREPPPPPHGTPIPLDLSDRGRCNFYAGPGTRPAGHRGHRVAHTLYAVTDSTLERVISTHPHDSTRLHRLEHPLTPEQSALLSHTWDPAAPLAEQLAPIYAATT